MTGDGELPARVQAGSSLRDYLGPAWEATLGGVSGQVSIVLHAGSAPVASLAETVPHYAASTIKLAVLGAWLESARTDGLLVHADFASAAGGRFSIRQADDQDDATWAALGSAVDSATLAARMIQVSGNLATNLLAEALGLDAIAAHLDRLGLGDSVRMGRLIGDTAAEAAGITNTVTAAGLAELLAQLTSTSSANDGSDAGLGWSFPEPVEGNVALDLLAGQQHRNLIPAGLPEGTWTASKSGWVPGVRHDVALVRPGGAPEYVLAVCTSGLPDDEAEALIRDLSRITWEEWMQWHG